MTYAASDTSPDMELLLGTMRGYISNDMRPTESMIHAPI